MIRPKMTFMAGAIVTVALTGCALGVRVPTGGANPAGPPQTITGRPGAAPVETDNEVATPPGPEEHAAGAGSAVAAVRGFATTYINWDAGDLTSRLHRLAAHSVGQARSAMRLAASQTRADPELAQAQVANRGRVEAVSALAGGGDRYVVVTLESTTATDSSAYQGLAPAWHLAVATVSRRGEGWVISGWQPES